jgi:hypothetical protein
VQEPPSFTMRTADGQLIIYLVQPTTVFRAGRDRPYSFGLLKAGDTARVRAGPGRRIDAGDGSARTARLVIVRPAGEQPGGQQARPGAAKASQKGGRSGAVQ